MTPNAEISQQLAFAIDICQSAGKLALKHFKHGVDVSLKQDNTPVTIADRECDDLLRNLLVKNFAQDAILSEESRPQAAGKGVRRKWIIDPIDGTYNFARGIPIFSILLALEENDEIVAGVVHNPALDETFYAERGGGAFRNGVRIKVSDISEPADSLFLFGAPNRILAAGLWEGFTRLVKNTYRQRGLGDYLNFAYVFEGKADAMLETGLNAWDIAPMKILIEEAGGCFSDLEGGKSIYTGNCLVSNGKVHEAYLRLLKMP